MQGWRGALERPEGALQCRQPPLTTRRQLIRGAILVSSCTQEFSATAHGRLMRLAFYAAENSGIFVIGPRPSQGSQEHGQQRKRRRLSINAFGESLQHPPGTCSNLHSNLHFYIYLPAHLPIRSTYIMSDQ
jgi:hypothetical protein